MSNFKIDRSAFKIQTFVEADKANIFDVNVTYSEGLREAYFLISKAYGFSLSNPPKIDKEYFSS
jgi:hypothetical protein